MISQTEELLTTIVTSSIFSKIKKITLTFHPRNLIGFVSKFAGFSGCLSISGCVKVQIVEKSPTLRDKLQLSVAYTYPFTAGIIIIGVFCCLLAICCPRKCSSTRVEQQIIIVSTVSGQNIIIVAGVEGGCRRRVTSLLMDIARYQGQWVRIKT